MPLPFDDRQRRVLVLVASVVTLLALALLFVALRGGADGAVTAGDGVDTTTTTEGATTTTVDLVAVPTTTPTTEAPPEATTTTVAAPAPELSPSGAVLRPPATSDSRLWDPSVGCAALASARYAAQCGLARAGGIELAWLVEANRATSGLRVSILRSVGGGRWSTVLAAVDDGPDGPARFAAVTVRVAALSDHGEQIVVGFRNQGSGGVLELDVVDAPGRVVVHRTLDRGEARIGPRRLEDWSAEYGPGDAQCCPSAWRRGVVEHVDGAWRLTTDTVEALSRPPDGDFD